MSRDLFLKKTNRDWSRSSNLEETAKSVARAAKAAERKVTALIAPARKAGYDARPRGGGVVVTKKWTF